MPATRSSTRLAELATAASAQTTNADAGIRTPSRKRKVESTLVNRKAKKSSNGAEDQVMVPTISQQENQASSASYTEDTKLVPAVLTFDYEEAKKHLIEVDHRFEDLFCKMKCKPFEHLERVHPFRALATSILGQQISWLAARSIIHKFIRLYNPSLPEKPTDEERRAITFFPTPRQVIDTDLAVLRTAGLSARKAEYIQDLAARFADGRLSTDKLLGANDEELAEMLIQVRGIGRWTVDMFAIFSLRRPDILPVGDLGVQRGLLRWFLSLHSPDHSFSIAPEKVGGSRETKSDDELPSVSIGESTAIDAESSSVLPDSSRQPEDLPEIPPSFTPSIKKVLTKPSADSGKVPSQLPVGLDVATMKSRLKGKKTKGVFLTPQEMASLTDGWKPFRSVGVYYMWSLADTDP